MSCNVGEVIESLSKVVMFFFSNSYTVLAYSTMLCVSFLYGSSAPCICFESEHNIIV